MNWLKKIDFDKAYCFFAAFFVFIQDLVDIFGEEDFEDD